LFYRTTCYMKKKMLLAFSPAYSRLCFLFLFFSLVAVGAIAQTVKGNVLDSEKKPVAGATVGVKGTTKATITDADGNFSINAAGNDIIMVSFVGFTTMEVPVDGKTNLAITLLRGDGTDLSEVVVTALGIRKDAKKLGYATTSVQPQELVTNRTTNVGE